MSYPPRKPGAPYAAPGGSDQTQEQLRKGSVKAARERLRVGQVPSAEPFPAQPPEGDSSFQPQFSVSNTPGRPQRAPHPFQAPDTGYVESDEYQSPPGQQQWPLRTTSGTELPEPQIQSRTGPRGPPPQRPPRVIEPPTFFDASRDTLSPDHLQPPQAAYWQDDDYLSPSYASPNMSRPLTDSSLASDSSSIGTIPDFPVPSSQVPSSRRSQNIGPPPSARRGPSSYYSQMSYVSPIAEESENRVSGGSFASSNVIPSGIPDFYLEDGEGETPSDEEDQATAGFDGRVSNVGDHAEKTTLVRQASLGKRGKPSLTTIRSGEAIRSNPPPMPQPAVPMQILPQEVLAPKQARSRLVSPLGSGSVLLDASSPSSSEESLGKHASRNNASAESLRDLKARSSYEIMTGAKPVSPALSGFQSPTARLAPRSPLVPVDPRVEQILGGLEKGGALNPGTTTQLREAKRGTLAERVGSKRPPRLNVDAVREAEVRGSLTSLPDLIRRATRLAANLDRGKTASRLGFEWLDFDKRNRSRELNPSTADTIDREKNRKSGTSLSGMLASFPPPGALTPTGNITPRTQWPSNNSQRSLTRRQGNSRRSPTPRGRRCCGMPMWVFLVLIFMVLLLVAAAIVLPVVLIVLPKRNAASTDTSAAARASCLTKKPCSNGGSSIVMADGSCGCLCTNGFTGSQCKNPSDAGCTTMSAAGVKNASVGNQIPTLMDTASSNYSIPLDEAKLLSLFASTNMTCGAENALVTLTGSSTKKRSEALTLEEREVNDKPGSAVTSSGILFAGSAAKPTQTTTGSPSSTSVIAITTGSSAPGTNTTSREFAKVGILFVLQESGNLDVAVKAQGQLSNYMNSATKQGSTMNLAHNVTLGSGYFIDLWYWTVTLKNGTQYGNGFNGTATGLVIA